jgi:hypothetical protein
LRRTVPIIEIVDILLPLQSESSSVRDPSLRVVHLSSLVELKKSFDWSVLRIYDLNAPVRIMVFCSGLKDGSHRLLKRR